MNDCEDHVARKRRRLNRPGIRTMLETTPARAASPAVPATIAEPLPDEDLGWTPLDLPRAVRSRRTYRIPVIVISLAAAVGVYFAAQFALRLPQAQAEGRRVASSDTLDAAANALPDLHDAAVAITTGSTGDLGPHLATLARVEGLAAKLQAEAKRSLPLLVPGLPNDDLTSLGPLQDRMGAVAERLTAVGVLLADTATYRRSLDAMFLLPELPGPDEGPSVSVFSDRLSQMTAATVSSASLLPVDELFADHRSQVEDLLSWLPEWQASYLEALRNDDLDTADDLRSQATARIEQLRQDLTEPLEAAATWATTTIGQLEADIAAALVLAG